MTKRTKIIIFSLITVVIVISLGTYFLLTKEKPNESIAETSTITNEEYYVEEGIEDPAKAARLAIEEYLNQDSTESTQSRNQRLEKYFTANSSVYNYEPLNLSDVVNKSTAEVTSITSCEEQEGGDWCLIIMADIKLFYENSSNNITKTYWMTLVKEANDDTFKPNDVGEWL